MNGEEKAVETGTVLLPLDGTPLAVAAFPVASRIAELANATLHIVHVAEEGAIMPLAELRERLHLTTQRLTGVVLDVVAGRAAEGIVRTAKEKNSLLIVMTTHTGPVQPESGLGSIAEAVLHRTDCPVLLVPPDRVTEGWQMHRVLLPQDGTPGAAAALEPVVHLAHHAGAALLILHVSGRGGIAARIPGALPIPRYMDQPQYEWPAWRGEFIDRVRGLCRLPDDFELRFFLAKGQAGSEILRVAEERKVDLIVLPWHGSLAPRHAPVVKAITRSAPCPVLILPYRAL